MPDHQTNPICKITKRRPPGVWILTIFALIFGGIFPLYFEPFDLIRGYFAFYAYEDIPIIIVCGIVNILIILASILTWKGSRFGRISFLVLITIYFLYDGITSFSWGRRIPDDLENWIWYITDFGFPNLCLWYFNRVSTKEIYGLWVAIY
jgi:hypothetical protein